MSARSKPVVLLVTLATVSALAGASGSNDAGSGTDAPGNPASPLQLPAFGSYTGGYKGPSDRDWYRATATTSAPQCVEITATGPYSAAHLVTRHTVAGAEVERTLLGTMDPDGRVAGMALRNLVRADVGLVAEGVSGAYSFSVREVAIPPLTAGDANTGGDIGDVIWNSYPISPACVGGFLAPGDFDLRDLFSVSAVAGDVLTVSFVESSIADLVLEVVRGSTVLATLADGGFVRVPVDSDGTYYVVVGTSPSGGQLTTPPTAGPQQASSSSSGGGGEGPFSYTMGIDLDGRCRPGCL